ncbi:conserved hypothetical protein [uncultured Alphaproteobacteria bacterium]|uniref:Flagellin N-terminal domain-containing protein n=1 Tax=uncultured Alphaproteobacteria bacterium TaxID=91750 RepID=A0A212JPZ7_9PROT|nr:conserved hypothetical protein [uncultured Alphaproteobacteria bacterium]
MSTILSNDGLASMSWQQVVYNQIVQRKTTELDATSTKLQEAFDSKSDYYDAQSNQLAKVKASISNADLAVDNGKDGIADIKEALLQMRILVGQYGEAESDEERGLIRDKFDEYVDKINRTADTYSAAYNPIGNVTRTDWTPNSIDFTKNLAGETVEMQGTYVGADFYIEADDGTIWVPDPGSSSITQYETFNTLNPADSTKGEGFVSTRNGLKLVDYQADTGDISLIVDPNNAATPVSGKLVTGGIGLMQSWFYGGLDTEEGRQAASAALDEADNLVAAAEARVGGMSTTVKAASTSVDRELEALNADRSEAMTEQLSATYALQVKQQQELLLLKQTFQNMASQQSYYKSIFAGAGTSPLFDFTS